MKTVGIGTGLGLLGVILSWIIWGAGEIYTIPAGLGLLFLIVMMFSSGAMVSGSEMRANLATETKEGRKDRMKIMKYSAQLALPNLIIAGFLYFSLN
ncbi:DUF5316 domain-containing protein [Jeotgalibacillus salarius]|uniref:DUF2269 family protein n=1 Tax=Jeotgalibacillus salarius TaxID=546023 RepID=A0A4Y8LHP6_9BACL|nr:DUF5316 domain-containing protein [Jeotgalibacillus salarius]TFE02264.1 hypothetical protein E2626_06705 [Jeotgalibacillus salarius]